MDYEYDDYYQLIHEHRIAYDGGDPGVAYEYQFVYDSANNRTEWKNNGSTVATYSYDSANKLMSKTENGVMTNYYYGDGTANMTSEVSGSNTTTYTWDYQSRMTRWEKTGVTTESYVYDADGMRVTKTLSGGPVMDFLLDGMEIAEEITGSNVTSNIGPRNTQMVRIIDSGRKVYSADAVGSTRAVTDATQAVVWSGIYDAYGNLLMDYSTSNVPDFGFAGTHRYYQDATGLQYLKNRYYDPELGRFISADPVRYGRNHFAYVGNRPTVLVDPLGLFPGAMGCAIGAGIGLVNGLVGGGGFADTACRTLGGCALGFLAEIACEGTGGWACKCAVGAAAGPAGAALTSACSQLGTCPKPFNTKCALYSAGLGLLTGCSGNLVSGAAAEDIMMKVMLKLFGMDFGSACNNSYPVKW